MRFGLTVGTGDPVICFRTDTIPLCSHLLFSPRQFLEPVVIDTIRFHGTVIVRAVVKERYLILNSVRHVGKRTGCIHKVERIVAFAGLVVDSRGILNRSFLVEPRGGHWADAQNCLNVSYVVVDGDHS
jgi:hypothetical protein